MIDLKNNLCSINLYGGLVQEKALECMEARI